MIAARTVKNVRPKGCPEVNCKSIKATYANNGPGKTGSSDPMIAMIHRSNQTTTNTISILYN
jgi:hypothetical protein